MRIHSLAAKEWLKAFGAGIATAVLLSVVMVPAMKLGFSPFPKPLGLAFAETVLGHLLPLPVGLLFHVAYVTFWSLAFVVLFRGSLSFAKALLLGLVLWIGVLVVFFSHRRLGFLRSWRRPEAHRRFTRAASVVRGVPLGSLPAAVR